MARVTVTPMEYTYVRFDGARIAALAVEVADLVGLAADAELHVEVDEKTPVGRVELVSVSPIVISVQGGAFEDAKRPRELSDRSVRDVLARMLFRVRDRLDPAFGPVPDDRDLTLQQSTAWDAYAVGRSARVGVEVSKPRRLYHFRVRHGFTDAADAAFERLWNGEGLTWADIEASSAAALGAEPVSA